MNPSTPFDCGMEDESYQGTFECARSNKSLGLTRSNSPPLCVSARVLFPGDCFESPPMKNYTTQVLGDDPLYYEHTPEDILEAFKDDQMLLCFANHQSALDHMNQGLTPQSSMGEYSCDDNESEESDFSESPGTPDSSDEHLACMTEPTAPCLENADTENEDSSDDDQVDVIEKKKLQCIHAHSFSELIPSTLAQFVMRAPRNCENCDRDVVVIRTSSVYTKDGYSVCDSDLCICKIATNMNGTWSAVKASAAWTALPRETQVTIESLRYNFLRLRATKEVALLVKRLIDRLRCKCVVTRIEMCMHYCCPTHIRDGKFDNYNGPIYGLNCEGTLNNEQSDDNVRRYNLRIRKV